MQEQEQMTRLEKKMDEVLFILQNNPGTGQPGLVAKVEMLQNEFHGFRNQYNVDQAIRKGKQTVWTMVFGFIGAGVWKLLGFFLFKH